MLGSLLTIRINYPGNVEILTKNRDRKKGANKKTTTEIKPLPNEKTRTTRPTPEGARTDSAESKTEESSSSNQASSSTQGLVEKITNLNTSDQELYDLIYGMSKDKSLSPMDEQMIANAFSRRTYLTNMLSNIFRTMFDGINSIIRNIRA